jgi:two-component system NarL family response regulator
MDLLLPDIGGAEVIKRVCSARSDTNFIVLTTVAGDEEIYRALEAGARGYLFKDMVEEMRQAAKSLQTGDAQAGRAKPRSPMIAILGYTGYTSDT